MSSGHNYLQDGHLSPQLLRTEATGTVDLCTVQREWRMEADSFLCFGGWDNVGDGKKLSDLVEGVTWE